MKNFDLELEKKKFLTAVDRIVPSTVFSSGIGTLGEKTLHSVIKHYIEPDEEKQEIGAFSFVADIFNEKGITEIQTGSLLPLRKKLDAMLPVCPVNVVHPLINTKWLTWINPDTGEVGNKRKSPKKETIYSIFRDLYRVRDYIANENFSLTLLFINVEEYRLQNGWSKDKKKGSSKVNRIPTELVNIVNLRCINDYKLFITESLPEKFTSKDYSICSHINLKTAQMAVNNLCYLELIKKVGKQGRMNLYQRL